MQVAGDAILRGLRSEVWEVLNDTAVLARCMPGCEKLEQIGPDRYEVALKVGIAAIKGNYAGTLVLAEQRPPESITLRVEANGSGGFAHIDGKMELHEQGDSTKLSYDWEVNVGGPVAMVGQRVLGGVAKMLIGDFFNKVQKELTARKGG